MICRARAKTEWKVRSSLQEAEFFQTDIRTAPDRLALMRLNGRRRQDDLPTTIVRKLIGPGPALGVSVFDASGTKPGAVDSIGLRGLAEIYSSVEVPIIASAE